MIYKCTVNYTVESNLIVTEAHDIPILSETFILVDSSLSKFLKCVPMSFAYVGKSTSAQISHNFWSWTFSEKLSSFAAGDKIYHSLQILNGRILSETRQVNMSKLVETFFFLKFKR